MTISSTTNRVAYTGNGATTAFAFGYKFLVNADLLVYQAGTLKTITTHYTVSGAGDDAGGTVTFLTAPANAESVVIVRDPAITQGTDLVENDPLPAETLENALDKLTIIAQRLDDRLDRSFVLSDSSTTSVTLTIPTPTANKGLRWNSAGTALENTTDDISDLATAAAASASAASASASAASASASAASSSASAAATAQTNAETAKTNAETAETNAETAEANAEAAAGAVGTQFTFDSSTTMADPGTGDFRLNNATVGSVTAIAVSALTSEAGNADVSAFIATWADSTNATVKGHITLKKSGTPATFATFSISAVTDNTTWLELTVSHVASNGTWSAADVAYIAYSRTGNKGTDGAGNFNADGSVPMTGNLILGAGVKIVAEGTTDDAFETTLDFGDPTADRTVTVPDETFTMGFRTIPQDAQSDNYTLVLSDSGKHIYETGASKTITIPANASVAFPIGTAVSFVAGANSVSIAITSDTMYLASSGATGTRTLAARGLATALKVDTTVWHISGAGLT